MSHSHAHSCSHDDPAHFTEEFWDDRYGSAGESGRLWSGQPNPQLVAQTADLAPGEALEAGCGEGADAIWLARQGWTVTAVDVSAVALERDARYLLVRRADGGRWAGLWEFPHHEQEPLEGPAGAAQRLLKFALNGSWQTTACRRRP